MENQYCSSVYMSLFQITLEGNKTIMAIPKRGVYFTWWDLLSICELMLCGVFFLLLSSFFFFFFSSSFSSSSFSSSWGDPIWLTGYWSQSLLSTSMRSEMQVPNKQEIKVGSFFLRWSYAADKMIKCRYYPFFFFQQSGCSCWELTPTFRGESDDWSKFCKRLKHCGCNAAGDQFPPHLCEEGVADLPVADPTLEKVKRSGSVKA